MRLRNFLVHLVIYLAAGIYLAAIDVIDGTNGETFAGFDWAQWPILVWLPIVVVHAVTLIIGKGDQPHTDSPRAADMPDDYVRPDSKAA